MRGALIILAMISFSFARGQHASAPLDFFNGLTDCAASLGGWKCLELDLSSEVTTEIDSSKVFEYSWNFGDGDKEVGSKIEHCYAEFGSYQVTMDLIDPETNTVIRNELSSTLHLFPEIHPAIVIRREGLPPGSMEFSFQHNENEDFDPDRVYWRIDGSYYEGRTIRHSFPVAGVYLVEMGVEKDMGFLGTVAACSNTEVTINESDVWTVELLNFIKKERERLQVGPFAYSEVMCLVKTNEAKGSRLSLVPLHKLMSHSLLKEGLEYEITLFSGSLFTDMKQLNTSGMKGNQLYSAVKDTIASFLDRRWYSLPSVRFEKNQTISSDANIKQVAEILLKFPHLRIEVGAYVHSGSRIVKGTETAVARAEAVKDALIALGVPPERVSVASPEYDRGLINTCSALPDCEWENKLLDGKVEFKITEIIL